MVRSRISSGKSIYFWLWVIVILIQTHWAVSTQAQTIQWNRQFGTGGFDTIYAVAQDAAGNVYVAGWVAGTLPGQTSSGGEDAFVRKYDPSGNELWTRQFGTSAADAAEGVSADSSGVCVMGRTEGALPGQTHAGNFDVFVRKYDTNGNELWTRQFGTGAYDDAFAGFADGSSVYVVGQTNGTLPGQSSNGGPEDAFIRKYDANGNELWTRQFGTGSVDWASGVIADGSGVYVGGLTFGALLGQTYLGGGDNFLRKYDASGNELWTREFGTSGNEGGTPVSGDGVNVYVAGHTNGTFPGQTNSGSDDAFVRKYDASGTEQWTRQFGSSASDADQRAVFADGSGVYLAGHTLGALPGQTNSGGQDVFVRKYDPSGNELWTLQFGTSGTDTGYGVTADAGGAYAGGFVDGTLPGETSAGGPDAYVLKLTEPPAPPPGGNATINVFSSLHSVGSGSNPGSLKSALMLDLKVFDKAAVGSPDPKDFGTIWNSGAGLTPPSVTIVGPTVVTVGGGTADRYVITGPANASYLVIGKALVNSTTVYVGSPTDVLATDSTTNKYLQVIQNGAGKIVPAKTTEVPGSLLLIAEPPEGFVSTPGALTADVSTSSLEAVQFTITDVGSSWTSARVTHRLRHKGRAITVVTEHPMVNRQRKRN